MNNKTIRTVTLAAFSILVLSMFSFYTMPQVWADIVVVDTSISGLTYVYSYVSSSGGVATSHVIGYYESGNTAFVKTYVMNDDGTLTAGTSIDISTTAFGGQARAAAGFMKCTGNICFSVTQGTVTDYIIQTNTLTLAQTGSYACVSGCSNAIGIVNSGLVYFAENSGKVSLLSAPAGGTFVRLAQSGTAWTSFKSLDYGVIGTTKYVALITNVANPTEQFHIYNVNNNGFATVCDKNVGATFQDIHFQDGLFWISATGTGSASGYDVSETGGTCDTADVSISGGGVCASSTPHLWGSTPDHELYIACNGATIVGNTTSGAVTFSVSNAVATETYVSYLPYRGALVVNSPNTVRVVFLAGLNFTNSNPEVGRTQVEENPSEGNPTNVINGVDCNLPENEFKLLCRQAENAGALTSAAVSMTQSGNNIVCQIRLISCTQDSNGQFTPDNPDIKTNGVGFMLMIVLLGIMIGIFWVASRGQIQDIPNYIWIVGSLGILGAATLLEWIDPTMLVIGVIAIIALAAAKMRGLLGGSGGGMLLAE